MKFRFSTTWLNITVTGDTHSNFKESPETNTKSGIGQPLDDKQSTPFDTIFSTAANELNKQKTVRLHTGSKNLDNTLNGGKNAIMPYFVCIVTISIYCYLH